MSLKTQYKKNNIMEKTGTIIHVLPTKTGEGKNGTWKKQEFVIETEEQFKKKICFQVWGDKIDTSKLIEGTKATVSLDVESREYNGNWYADIKAWKVDVLDAGFIDPQQPPLVPPDLDMTPKDDGLPF
jgi:hypothetical protein